MTILGTADDPRHIEGVQGNFSDESTQDFSLISVDASRLSLYSLKECYPSRQFKPEKFLIGIGKMVTISTQPLLGNRFSLPN